MKRKTKKLLITLALAATSVCAMLFASCGAGDWFNEKIDQLTCKHEYDDGIELETATCSEYGKVLKTCTICYYEKTEKIDKLPHTETVVAAEAPTCTKAGKTDGVKCSVCDEIIVRQKSVPALGHDITILEAVEPTCLTSGKTEGKYCNRCNETVVEQKTISALGHKVTTTYGKEATCTESGLTNGQKCVRCDTVYVAQKIILASGHNFGEWIIDNSPSCVLAGSKHQTCSNCNEIRTEEISSVGHSFAAGECTICGVVDVSAVAAMAGLEVENVSVYTPLDRNAVYRLDLSRMTGMGMSSHYVFTLEGLLNESFFESKDSKYREAYDAGLLTLGTCDIQLRFETESGSVVALESYDTVVEWHLGDESGNKVAVGYFNIDFEIFTYAFSADMQYLYFTLADIQTNQGYFTISSILSHIDVLGLEKVIL